MINYVRNHLNTFEMEPVNEIDFAILSWLSYLTLSDFPDIGEDASFSLRDIFCAECFDKMTVTIKSREESLELLTACVSSPRFRNVRILDYREKLDDEVQFSAVTYQLMEDYIYVSFRGTDNSFIGWKEDLALSLVSSIPSQDMAVEYLNRIMSTFDGKIMMGGHSKGGNLAVYAASECVFPERIDKIYSFDGPGFTEKDMEHDGFLKIREKIVKIVPKASLIGMLFENETEIRIVNSRSVSLGQHNMLNWEIRDGEFVYMESLSDGAKLMYRSLNGFMNDLSYDDREKMINTIFDVLEETGVSDFETLIDHIQENLPVIVRKYASLDKKTRKFMRGCLRKLAENGVKSIPDTILDEMNKNNAD